MNRLGPWAGPLLLWLCVRLAAFRALPDFFDSPEFLRRVQEGVASALHDPTGHLPYQGTLLAPAAAIHHLAGLAPTTSIAVCSMAWGALAFASLVALWRSVFPPQVALRAAYLWPLLAGPALADSSTYSMSVILACLAAGTWLMKRGLDGSRRDLVLAGVVLGLGVYTHLLTALWLSVPVLVVMLRVVETHRARSLVVAAACVTGAVVSALLVGGAELVVNGRAEDVVEGIRLLVLRDAGAEKWWQLNVRQFALVTGGLGLLFLGIGAVRWGMAQPVVGSVTVLALALSVVVCGFQYHWGFMGRLYLPLLCWGVPWMVFHVGRNAWMRMAERAALGVLVVQSSLTCAHVMGTRRVLPHPGAEELRITAAMPTAWQVTAPMTRAWSALPMEHTVSFGSERDASAVTTWWNTRVAAGDTVVATSEVLRYPHRVRDGHLVSTAHTWAPGGPTEMERWLREHAAVVPVAPLGHAEFLAELIPAERAPVLGERVTRALHALEPGASLLVIRTATPAWYRVDSNRGWDCVPRDNYDAMELSAWLSAIRAGCMPLHTAATDVTGVIIRPLVPRDSYRVTGVPDQGDRVELVEGNPRVVEPVELATAWNGTGEVASMIRTRPDGRVEAVDLVRPGRPPAR